MAKGRRVPERERVRDCTRTVSTESGTHGYYSENSFGVVLTRSRLMRPLPYENNASTAGECVLRCCKSERL